MVGTGIIYWGVNSFRTLFLRLAFAVLPSARRWRRRTGSEPSADQHVAILQETKFISKKIGPS